MNGTLKILLDFDWTEGTWRHPMRAGVESKRGNGFVSWVEIVDIFVNLGFLFDGKWDCTNQANTEITLIGQEVYLGEVVPFHTYAETVSMSVLPEEFREMVRKQTLEVLRNFPDLAEKIESRKGYW